MSLTSTKRNMQYNDVGASQRDLLVPSGFLRKVANVPLKPEDVYTGGFDNKEIVDRLWLLWNDVAITLFDDAANYTATINTKEFSADGVNTAHGPLTQASGLDVVKTNAEDFARKTLTSPKLADHIKSASYFTKEQIASAGTDQVFYWHGLLRKPKDGSSYYKFYTVALYDFTIAPLNDSDAANEIGEAVSAAIINKDDITRTYSTVNTNNSLTETGTASTELQTSISSSVSKSASNTSEYSMSSSFNSTTTISAGYSFFGATVGLEQSFELGFSSSSLFSATTGTTLQTDEMSTTASTVSLPLPPHTAAVLTIDSFNGNRTVNYEYPISVQYKVQMICMHRFNDKRWQTIHNFSQSGTPTHIGNAADSFIDRYTNMNINGYEIQFKNGSSTTDPLFPGVEWAHINNGTGNAKGTRSMLLDLRDKLANNRPSNSAGGSLTVATTGSDSRMDVYPTYPLRKVNALNPQNRKQIIGDMELSSGAKLYVDTISLEGRNAQNVRYNGFDKVFGHWILQDANGNDITASGNGIASLKTDPTTKRVYLEAGATAGDVSLKYLIDEDHYAYYMGSQGLSPYTTNAELTDTAIVKIQVSGYGRP